MRKKSIATLLAALTLFTVMVNAATHVFAASKELGVAVHAQEKTNWCWAACATMAGRYVYPTTSPYTQSQIVFYVKGAVVNEGTDYTGCATSLRYATFNNYSTSYASGTNKWSFSKIKNSIDKAYPVLVVVSSSTAHERVVYGYNNDTAEIIKLNNPSGNGGVGNQQTVLFSEFVNGTSPIDSRPYAATVYFTLGA